MLVKKDIAKALSEETGFTIKDCEAVLSAEREVFIKLLAQGESIKPFNGLTIVNTMVEAHERVMPDDKRTILVPARPKIKARISEHFKRDFYAAYEAEQTE